MSPFKKKFSIKKRLEESKRILEKYPDRVPVIVERSSNSSDISEIDKQKYLVPKDLTVGQFIYVIRKRIKLESEQAIFLFINNLIPLTSRLMGEVYIEFKDKDNFLYVEYSGESCFGSDK